MVGFLFNIHLVEFEALQYSSLISLHEYVLKGRTLTKGDIFTVNFFLDKSLILDICQLDKQGQDYMFNYIHTCQLY